jgi:hypothetical protein
MRPDRSALRTFAAIVCLTMLVACDGSPTTPPLTVDTARFDGAWQIEYRTTSCTGWRHCVFRVGKTSKALLTLSQTGRDVTGVLEVGNLPMDVSGTVNAGQLTLAGVASAHSHEFALTEYDARQLGHSGMTGVFAYTEQGEAQGDFAGSARTTAEIVSAVREPKSD